MFEELEGGITPSHKPSELFATLLPRLPRLRALANHMSTPNPEDDLPTRLAIVGFSYSSPTEHWSHGHFQRLHEYRVRELSPEALSGYAAEAPICEEFSCLALGYVLGLREAGKINDTDVFHAECLLPGFLMLKSGQLGRYGPGAA
jgi:hypothetical protein